MARKYKWNIELKAFLADEFPEISRLWDKERRTNRMERTETVHMRRKKYNSQGYVALETPKMVSSCRCCINPRRLGKGPDKLTLQERRRVEYETSLAD